MLDPFFSGRAMNSGYADLKKSLFKYASMPDSEWEYIANGLSVVHLPKGEYYTRINDTALSAGYVVSGILKSFYLDKHGNEFVRSFASAGSYLVALSSGLLGKPSNVSIRVLQDATILSSDFSLWRNALDRHPCWNEIQRKITERYYIDREEHVIELLTLTALERYHRFLDRFPDIAPIIPQKDIAAYIGITPVALSRIIAKE